MAYALPALSTQRGSIRLANHLGGTGNLPTVVDHGTIASGDRHTEYLKADGSRALSGNQSAGGFKLTSLGTPTSDGDAATKAYVDSIAAATVNGYDWKNSAKLASAAALPAAVYDNGSSGVGATLTGVSVGALTIDGTAAQVGWRVLIMDQADHAQDGIYTVTAAGSVGAVYVLTRATDCDSANDYTTGAYCWVEGGSTKGAKGFAAVTTGAYVLGTTAVTWSQVSGLGQVTAGAGLTKTGDTINLDLSSATPVTITATAAVGTSETPAREDHAHAHSQIASGDLHTEYASKDGSKDITGTWQPSATGVDLGATGKRWDLFAQDINASGGVTLQAAVATDSDITVGAQTFCAFALVTSGTGRTVTLPAATTGRFLAIKVAGPGAAVVTVTPNGAELVEGGASLAMTAGDAAFLIGVAGTGWAIL